MKTRKLRLPLMHAIEACAAVLPHASTDDVTPVIRAAHISGDRIVATDRYTVGTFRLVKGLAEGASVLLPLEAVKWVAKFVTKHLLANPNEYTLMIEAPEAVLPNMREWSEEDQKAEVDARAAATVRISVESKRFGVEALRRFRPQFGHFPRVERIIDGHEEAWSAYEVTLRAVLLERFTDYARRWGHGNTVFQLGARDDDGKDAPVRITIGERFVGAVQPQLGATKERG